MPSEIRFASKTSTEQPRVTKSMRIQLQLSSNLMECLSAEAKARGVRLEDYAETLQREAIATRTTPLEHLSLVELHGMLTAIAEGTEKLPKVPTSASTRESFYK